MPDMLDLIDDSEARFSDAMHTALMRQAEAEAKRPGRVDCENCGEEIAPARREALPHAVTCIDCASARDWHARGRR